MGHYTINLPSVIDVPHWAIIVIGIAIVVVVAGIGIKFIKK